MGEGGGFRAAGGEDVEDGEIAVGVGGAMQSDLAAREWGLADAGDGGMSGEAGLGGFHAGDGAAEHGLDGSAEVYGIEGVRIERLWVGRSEVGCRLVG